MALDPALLMCHLVEPDPWQLEVVRSTTPRLLINCSRQSGKSTTTAAIALHTALYQPASLILLLSPGERQSKELLRKVTAFYGALDRPVPAEAESTLTLELENGSRIIALPSNEATIRGYSGVRLLIVDEASRVPDVLYASVRPMLAVSGGRLLALSTPYGKRGWWYEAWERGEAWERIRITAHECPRISVAFLEEEQRALGARWYTQEYECTFSDLGGGVYPSDVVDRMLSDEVAPLFGDAALVAEHEAGESAEPLFAI